MALVDITSIIGFVLNFDLILLFGKSVLVLIFVSVVSLTFKTLPFVLTVGVINKISEPNIFYSKLLKIVPLAIIFPSVLDK